MGTFKKLINYDKIIRIASTGNYNGDNSWTDVSGTTRNSVYGESAVELFRTYGNYELTYTQQSSSSPNLFPHPSSDSDIPYNSTTVPNEITATTSVAYSRFANGHGWVANITITGSGTQDETVRSLVFTKVIYYGQSNYGYGVVFAYIFDTPIVLDESNNYTANITLSVAFE